MRACLHTCLHTCLTHRPRTHLTKPRSEPERRPDRNRTSSFGLRFVAALMTGLAGALPSLPVDAGPATVTGAGPRGWSEELVVSAGRLRSTAAESGSSVWIIDETLIRQRAQVDLIDVLASAPGVTINQNGPFGGQATARIRGAASGQTLVLLDGVPVNDVTSPAGGFDFGPADTSGLARIEILKGPQSTLWGSDAIGGVVNLVTHRPRPGLRGGVGLGVGSYGDARVEARVEGGNDRGAARLTLAHRRLDGISRADEADGNTEKDGHEVHTVTLAGRVAVTRDVHLDLDVRHFEADTEFDAFGVVTGTMDGDERSRTRQTTAQLALGFAAFEGRLDNRFKFAWTDLDRDSFSGGAPSFSASGQRRFWQYQGNLALGDRQQLAFGVEHEDTEDGDDEAGTDGAYVLYELRPIDALTLAVGVRSEDTDRFGSETVGRLSAAYRFVDALTLRASWGAGFKAPTIFQNTFFCCGAVAPNPDLRAESSEGWDVGADLELADGRAAVALTWFHQDTTDQIDFDFAAGGYLNIAEVETDGVEFAFDVVLTDHLDAAANLTWLDSRDGNDQALARTPEWTADISLNWRPRADVDAALVLIHNGEETDSYGTVDAWTRADATVNWRVNDKLTVFGRLENLTDTDYQQVFGYGTPGRSGRVGFRVAFR